MSTTEVATTVVAPAGGALPRERRVLVALLAGLEGALLIAAAVLAYVYRPQPIPAGVPVSGSGSIAVCIQPGGAPYPVPYPCPPLDNSYQTWLLVAAACSAVALLVLPVVIGLVSRRWQSALAAPAIPLWVALLVLTGIALATDSSAFAGYGGSGVLGGASEWTLTFSLAGPALSALLLATAFGGLGWLARRAFAR